MKYQHCASGNINCKMVQKFNDSGVQCGIKGVKYEKTHYIADDSFTDFIWV